ncbi:MAG: hypothetical protein GX264_02290 [Clostridiales bacterium]|jgi:hypothetical protein|nr:hypothetical protein [Clostridiales bacterium]
MSVYLQLERSADGFVESLAPVIFDYTAISSDDISYDSDTGEITVNKRGVYQISWSVVSQSSQNSTVSFDLRTDEGANNIEGSPSKTGQVSGVATISVELPPTKFELVNTGVDRVYFSPNVATKARLSVIEASPQSDTTIPFASADPIEISADINGVQPEYMSFIGFGSRVNGIPFDIIKNLNGIQSDSNLNYAFCVTKDGFITNITAFFSIIEPIIIDGIYAIHAALYISESSNSNIFVLSQNANAVLAPNLDPGNSNPGTTFSVSYDLMFPEPVSKGDRLLLAVYLEPVQDGTSTTINGYFSGGILIS